MEAYAIFGEYVEREAHRLAEKLRLIESGQWTACTADSDAAERLRNDAIGQRAVDAETDAAQLWDSEASKCLTGARAPEGDLFDGLAA